MEGGQSALLAHGYGPNQRQCREAANGPTAAVPYVRRKRVLEESGSCREGQLTGLSCELTQPATSGPSRPPPTSLESSHSRDPQWCVLAASASVARAQSIEPRAYSNAPVGVNFLLAGPYYTRGGLSFDTSRPVTDPQLKTYNAVLGYARALELWGKSGKFAEFVIVLARHIKVSTPGRPIRRICRFRRSHCSSP